MHALCKIVSVPVLLLALAGFLGCGVVAVGVWMVRDGLTQRVERITGEIKNGVDRTNTYLQSGNDILQLAVIDSGDVTTTVADGGGDPARTAIVRRLARDKVLKKLAPEIDTIAERLTALTGTVHVVNSAVRSFNQLPFAALEERADTDLGGFSNRLSDLTRAFQDLRGAVNDEAPANNSLAPVQQHAGRVDSALKEILAVTTDWQAWLVRLSERVGNVEANAGRWFTIGSIGVTVLFTWFAFGQLSLLVHAWGWLRGRKEEPQGS